SKLFTIVTDDREVFKLYGQFLVVNTTIKQFAFISVNRFEIINQTVLEYPPVCE
ncbi:7367_t:CDS:1, partial [Rhizophagus irregularis]